MAQAQRFSNGASLTGKGSSSGVRNGYVCVGGWVFALGSLGVVLQELVITQAWWIESNPWCIEHINPAYPLRCQKQKGIRMTKIYASLPKRKQDFSHVWREVFWPVCIMSCVRSFLNIYNVGVNVTSTSHRWNSDISTLKPWYVWCYRISNVIVPPSLPRAKCRPNVSLQIFGIRCQCLEILGVL